MTNNDGKCPECKAVLPEPEMDTIGAYFRDNKNPPRRGKAWLINLEGKTKTEILASNNYPWFID